MARIFICYRREDSSGHAGRLYDRLRAHFDDDVFMDIDAIGPGVDYAALIDETLETVEIVIVMIGRQWLGIHDEEGVRRLDDPLDLVRQEVQEALTQDVLVIPVLVQGATLPPPDDLPPELAALSRRNAFELSDGRWNYDAERLVGALEQTLAIRAEQGSPPSGGEPLDRRSSSGQTRKDRVEVSTRSSAGQSAPHSAILNPPSVLVVAGLALVAIWGLVVGPQWHPEGLSIRIMAAVIVVGGAATALRAKRWDWAMVAGAAGLAGFGLWVVQLRATHSLSDFMSIGTDGVTNGIVLVGAALVTTGGWLGRGSETTGERQARAPKVRI